ncbi:dethiobiotin synthase [Legionella taurinensis]|uniref:ATP-dependent dethiobiotin synthetase BioD n=1 Tax=Legionella taurinensis TaxID=70611 RepID=A0AB38N254_9GAMM|nr:dethiobiotin synthase [Legionella taurinensis]MDX1838308.1 dethiobiotin synthase [Legionella taurinensis]PUT39204.1 dethiobiotin synthase [Legionella taurinensis]PUT39527.1 dethiobiotin synthase [Legionella taurinensis]PUT43970.1 dethiobiotin synthase [Legionella taurinensis]PUT45030.1 dethiobiotin synthase [Legionella taurinensis]
MKTFFITGTNTDCGKTYTTCQLIDFYRRQGRQVLALKPVATGCVTENGDLYSEDARLLKHHAGSNEDNSHWLFEPPISPHIAAAKAGTDMDARAILDYCLTKALTGPDLLLIEGAGGLMVPVNAKETWIDFLTLSQIPVILVVGMRLGCINHALLTAAVLKAHAIPCAGWIANCLDEHMLCLDENLHTLRETMGMPYLGRIPFQGQWLPEAIDFDSLPQVCEP